MTDLDHTPDFSPTPVPSGRVELVCNADHLDRVLLGGILKAQSSLALMTADLKAVLLPDPARRRGAPLLRQLKVMANNGVEIRILHAGVPSSSALSEMKGVLPERLQIRRCPRLHTKLAIIDCNAMYMGSANLTGAGLGAKSPTRRNFEMGIWTESTELIDAAMLEFNQLWEGQYCENCGRKDICPVPLEEPDL